MASKPPTKVGVKKSAKAGFKPRLPATTEPAGEPEKTRDARAARKGQSGKKGRPLPSREVAPPGKGKKGSKR